MCQTARLLTWSESEEGWGCCLHLTSSLVFSLPETWRQVNCLRTIIWTQHSCKFAAQWRKNLHVNFGHKNSFISIQEQPSIKVSALEVMFLVLLVEAFSLWWKGLESQVAKWLPTNDGKHCCDTLFRSASVHKHISLILYIPEVLNTNNWI